MLFDNCLDVLFVVMLRRSILRLGGLVGMSTLAGLVLSGETVKRKEDIKKLVKNMIKFNKVQKSSFFSMKFKISYNQL